MSYTLAFIKMAVLKALETDVDTAAATFGVEATELAEEQKKYLLDQLERLYPTQPVALPEPLSKWQQLRSSAWFDALQKMAFTGVLMLVFWAMPFVLHRFFDPLTNTVVWAGFTALYLMAFGTGGVIMIFWVMHHVNFEFFNRFANRGEFDYTTLMKSDDVTPFQKCLLNLVIFLGYVYCYCFLASSLLNQFSDKTG